MLALGGATSGSPASSQRRQTFIEPLNGITEPAAGSTIIGGDSFPFSYTVSDFCHNGYSPYSVWVVPGPTPPTAASLNSTQGFSDGDFLASFGSYLAPNFGRKLYHHFFALPRLTQVCCLLVPVMAPGPAPDAFTMPILDPSYVGSTVYVTVVETVPGCPVSHHSSLLYIRS